MTQNAPVSHCDSSLVARPFDLPSFFPAWARSLAEAYFSGTTCLFVLHGNVHDLIPLSNDENGGYCGLPEFLAAQVFGSWHLVLHYDLGQGLRPMSGGDPDRLKEMVQYLTARMGEPASWPRDPDKVLLLLDALIERNLLEDDPGRRKKIAVVLDYAQYLAPAGDLGALARGQGTNLVRMLSWAQNPYIKRINVAFILVADKLSEVNDRLVQSPHVAAIEIPLPDITTREAFARWAAGQVDAGKSGSSPVMEAQGSTSGPPTGQNMSPAELAVMSNGLSLVNLNVVLSQARHAKRGVDPGRFKQLKKTMIERQCQGLVEFVEPPHTLDLVTGQAAAKQRLRDDADLILHNRLEAAPMGYLLSGPVGTGKTFLAECYAGSVGIPCLKLRNFRSKYVGETEGNLENVLTVLRSLGPVVVIIDEADAALGNRSAEGDSGTSSRVFSMIASQMGDTRYRGKIVWMLLTCRPDLLPIDLKRQGRAEVHIPMFYPQDEAEVREMFLAMARKNKVVLRPETLPPITAQGQLSGADIESIVLTARRKALGAGRTELAQTDVQEAFTEFIPSAHGLEKELQELAAVLECTQLTFLPPKWRARVAEPGGRAQLQERMMAIRSLLKD
ncbi:MAG: ATP-binding protein [Phycisphaerae bacterium]|nr:ATP-binding protein [Phycisphaerae bacterium]